jgi:hypothetical protein
MPIFGLSVVSLLGETASLIGFKRMGSNIRAALTEAYEALMREGMLILRDGYVKISDQR